MPKREFLDEIKIQYNKEFEIQRNLDGKATSLIATAGTLTGLLFGFGTFLLTNIKPSYTLSFFAISLLMVAIGANIATVFFCIRATILQRYLFAMKHNEFFTEEGYSKEEIEKGLNYNEDKILKFVHEYSYIFEDRLIRAYLRCNNINSGLNDVRGKRIRYGQIIFLIGLFLIPIFSFIVLHAFITGEIKSPPR